jgi:hypothetical protein
MNKIQMMKTLIDSTKGRFFVINFVKSNGEVRKMLTRTGVSKGVKGTGLPNTKENILRAYDLSIGQWRSINLETVQKIKCGKVLFEEL